MKLDTCPGARVHGQGVMFGRDLVCAAVASKSSNMRFQLSPSPVTLTVTRKTTTT